MLFWVPPFEDRLGDLVNGSLVLNSSVRYLDRPWIRGILSKDKMIMFWPIQLAELGAVYALYQKWLIRWPKPWIFAIFFVDSNLHWAIC
jgi:hypothetical protein